MGQSKENASPLGFPSETYGSGSASADPSQRSSGSVRTGGTLGGPSEADIDLDGGPIADDLQAEATEQDAFGSAFDAAFDELKNKKPLDLIGEGPTVRMAEEPLLPSSVPQVSDPNWGEGWAAPLDGTPSGDDYVPLESQTDLASSPEGAAPRLTPLNAQPADPVSFESDVDLLGDVDVLPSDALMPVAPKEPGPAIGLPVGAGTSDPSAMAPAPRRVVGSNPQMTAIPRLTSGLTLTPRRPPPSVDMPPNAPAPVKNLEPTAFDSASTLPPLDEPSADADPPSVSDPCALLVVGPHRAVGAQTAAGLMAYGYTCRVVEPAEVAAALSASSFEVAICDLPATAAQGAGASDILGPLVDWPGLLILTSTVPIDASKLSAIRSIAATLTKPYHNDDLVRALEAAREARPVRTPVARAASLDRGGYFELTANMVRSIVTSEDGQASRGRIRAMSYDGGMVCDLKQPFEKDQPLSTELITVDGNRQIFTGKVSRNTADQMLINLKVTEEDEAHLRRFIDEARDVTQPSIYQVRIRAKVRSTVMEATLDGDGLAQLWNVVSNDIGDDALQQKFIQACLRAQKVEYAVKCYRDLKEDRPEDDRIQKYLNQVGTILGFYALRKETTQVKEEEGGLPSSVKWALGLFILSAAILFVLAALFR